MDAGPVSERSLAPDRAYALYTALLRTYLRQRDRGATPVARLIEAAICLAVRALRCWQGMSFPARSVGGWWWTWRWQFEALMGWQERESLHWCRMVLRPGMTVLDVGAHIGYYSRRLAALVGPTGRVFAFEANPENYAVLTANVRGRRYRAVAPFNVAVSDRDGTARLHVSPGSSNHSLLPGYTTAVDLLETPTVALDSFLAERGIDAVDFVKIDVEGAEPIVLAGMVGIIARSPHLALLLESNPQALRCGGVEPRQFVELLQEFGFRVDAIQPDGRLAPPADDEAPINLLCRRISASVDGTE
jgi:FkbM family methyltransferase